MHSTVPLASCASTSRQKSANKPANVGPGLENIFTGHIVPFFFFFSFFLFIFTQSTAANRGTRASNDAKLFHWPTTDFVDDNRLDIYI